MGDELNTLVECHSGYEYAERPTALRWQGKSKHNGASRADAAFACGRPMRVCLNSFTVNCTMSGASMNSK